MQACRGALVLGDTPVFLVIHGVLCKPVSWYMLKCNTKVLKHTGKNNINV